MGHMGCNTNIHRPHPDQEQACYEAERGAEAQSGCALMAQVLRGGVLYVHLNQAHNLARKRGLYGGPTKDM